MDDGYMDPAIQPAKCKNLADDLRHKVARGELDPADALAQIKSTGCGFQLGKLVATDKLQETEIKEIWRNI